MLSVGISSLILSRLNLRSSPFSSQTIRDARMAILTRPFKASKTKTKYGLPHLFSGGLLQTQVVREGEFRDDKTGWWSPDNCVIVM